MRGIIRKYENDPKDYITVYDSEQHKNIDYIIKPGRLNNLKLNGVELNVNDEVDFQIEMFDHYPYHYAVPYVETKQETSYVEPKKTVKKYKLKVYVSNFSFGSTEIVCDNYETSSSGYWYFYNTDENNRRQYLGFYPIDKTVISKIQEIEVEID